MSTFTESNGGVDLSSTGKKSKSNTDQHVLTNWQKFRVVYRTVCIMIHNMYCIPSYMVWMLVLRPVLYFNPDLYWQIESVLFDWLLTIVGYWLWSAGYTVAESGVDVDQFVQDEAIVLCNHQSTGDVPLLMHIFSHHPRVNNSMLWIMEAIFKFTNFGWVSMVHGDFFILQGKSTRSQELVRLQEHMRTVYRDRDRKWVLIFPEGGFLRKRKETSQQYARKNGYAVLQHVTLPRLGAIKATIDGMQPPSSNGVHNGVANGVAKNSASPSNKDKKLKWVIDMTVGYPDGGIPIDAFCVLGAHRPPCETKVHYRVFAIADIPTDEDEMLHWLYSRWEEKEQLLQTLYGTGKFPTETTPSEKQQVMLKEERKLITDDVYVIGLHLFYILSFYAWYTLISDFVGLFF